jgi:hypothetical protein
VGIWRDSDLLSTGIIYKSGAAGFSVARHKFYLGDDLGVDFYQNSGDPLYTFNGKLDVQKTTEQFRLAYDGSNYLAATVGSSGGTTWSINGNSAARYDGSSTSGETRLLVFDVDTSSATWLYQ